MIVRFMRLLGSVFFSCCDPDNECDHLQPNRRATQNRHYHYQYDSDNESDRFRFNGRTNPNGQNHYQYYDDSLKANLLAPSPALKLHSSTSFGSPARSNTSSYLPTNGVYSPTIKSAPLNNNLVGKTTGFPARQSFVDSSNASKRSSQSKIESNVPRSFHPTKIGSHASNYSLLFNPTPKVVSGCMQIKPPFEQSDVKLNISTSSFPLKPVSSSSPQRPGVVSFVQSDVKSNTSTSSFSTKTVQSSSPVRLDGTSLPNNFTTKHATSSCMQWVAKSNSPKNSQAPKTILAVSPTQKDACSPIYSTRQTITSPFGQLDAGLDASITTASSKAGPGPSEIEDPNKVGKGGTQRYEIPKHIEEMIKTVQSSFPVRLDGTSLPNNFTHKPTTSSCMQWVAKSNSPKNSQASKTIPVVSPIQKAASSPFVQLDAELDASITSASSKAGPGPSEIEDPNKVGKGGTQRREILKPIEEMIKTVQSSSPVRLDGTSLPNNFTNKPATSSCMQWVAKSNSPKNSQASKTIPAASPTQKDASSPIHSTRQTITSPFVQSDAELDASITSTSSKAGPNQSEIEDPNKVGKGGTQRYEIPKHIEEMIKNDIVPPVLKMPLSPVTYADYFAALLYAEDFYCEKWSKFLLEDVTLKLQDQSDTKKSKKGSDSKTKKKYPLVVFEIKEVPERRPFLLSRDHVHLRPVGKGKDLEPFHGVLICVVKSTTRIGSSVLAEFKKDFHKQHEPSKRYDVSFSFNRVCLKRAHRAVSAAANPLLRKILFPNPSSLPKQWGQVSPVDQILNHKFAPIPYLIEGPPSMVSLIKDIVLKIYESCKESRVLICAPKNYTCDALASLIMEKVCEIDIFRANAAFRNKDEVPDDIMPACLFSRECFTCPPLDELERFRIITSTFVSTFRLYNAGLKAGHFSHIFLLDASSAIEPEMIVALVDLVSEDTVVMVTGTAQDKPRWVRSDIARKHGLSKSFFERLLDREPYRSDNQLFITRI